MIPSLMKYLKVAADLRSFLAEILTPQRCREIIKKRLQERETQFLNIVEKGIYNNEKSPYLKLLELADCEFDDIRSSVVQHGIEKTLHMLRESGVYLTYEEFKGRTETARGGRSFRFRAEDFNNPDITQHLKVQTGGTTGSGVSIALGFKRYAQIAPHRSLLFEVHGLWEAPLGLWFPILPAITGVGYLLHSTKVGKVPSRWFSQVDREYIQPSFGNRFRTNWLVYAGRFWGTPFPKPEFVDLSDAARIAGWVSEMIRNFSRCSIATYPSSAVRICHAALEGGLNIAGAKFISGGEPITTAKVREISSAGAEIIPQYAFAEGGTVGYGCANPVHPDEIHLLQDCFALIQHQRNMPETGWSIDAFLFTSLLPSAPKILLNVDVGDYGTAETRRCGCGFEDMGFDVHLHGIRSFEKMNSEGMTLVSNDLLRLVEEVLPSKYGGNSTDYQIVEGEDDRGLTRLCINVSPRIGVIDEQELLRTVYGECRRGKNDTVKSAIFSQADTFRIMRRHPVSTGMGKIFPLHLKRWGHNT